jgi:hypothetical protein
VQTATDTGYKGRVPGRTSSARLSAFSASLNGVGIDNYGSPKARFSNFFSHDFLMLDGGMQIAFPVASNFGRALLPSTCTSGKASIAATSLRRTFKGNLQQAGWQPFGQILIHQKSIPFCMIGTLERDRRLEIHLCSTEFNEAPRSSFQRRKQIGWDASFFGGRQNPAICRAAMRRSSSYNAAVS